MGDGWQKVNLATSGALPAHRHATRLDKEGVLISFSSLLQFLTSRNGVGIGAYTSKVKISLFIQKNIYVHDTYPSYPIK